MGRKKGFAGLSWQAALSSLSQRRKSGIGKIPPIHLYLLTRLFALWYLSLENLIPNHWLRTMKAPIVLLTKHALNKQPFHRSYLQIEAAKKFTLDKKKIRENKGLWTVHLWEAGFHQHSSVLTIFSHYCIFSVAQWTSSFTRNCYRILL